MPVHKEKACKLQASHYLTYPIKVYYLFKRQFCSFGNNMIQVMINHLLQ